MFLYWGILLLEPVVDIIKRHEWKYALFRVDFLCALRVSLLHGTDSVNGLLL